MPRAPPSHGQLALSSCSAVGILLPFQDFCCWALFHGNREKQPGEPWPPGSISHHRARYCSQEVTATSRTGRRVITQPHCSPHRVITAAQHLQDSPAHFCGKPLLDSPSKCFPPWEASIFTNCALVLLGNLLLPSWPCLPLCVCSMGGSPGRELKMAGTNTSRAGTGRFLLFLPI